MNAQLHVARAAFVRHQVVGKRGSSIDPLGDRARFLLPASPTDVVGNGQVRIDHQLLGGSPHGKDRAERQRLRQLDGLQVMLDGRLVIVRFARREEVSPQAVARAVTASVGLPRSATELACFVA